MYKIELTKTAQKEILSFPEVFQGKIEAIIDSLETQPRPLGSKKLKGRDDTWRIRIGDYRILYGINDHLHVIIVYRIRHRKEVYK